MMEDKDAQCKLRLELNDPTVIFRSKSKREWACSLPVGHEGGHVAHQLHDLNQIVLATWGVCIIDEVPT